MSSDFANFVDLTKNVDKTISDIVDHHTVGGARVMRDEDLTAAHSKMIIFYGKLFESLLKTPTIFIEREEGAQLPEYATDGAAGADVRALISAPVTLLPGERLLIPTGLKADIPAGYEIQVRPRSGLALKNGITILNSPGTIDSDYKGPIGVILANFSDDPFEVKPGDRIGQLVVAKVESATFLRTEKVGTSERGEGGFGSTGVQ